MKTERWPFLVVLANRNFFFLWIGQILSQFATNITLFLLALIVYKATASNTAVSGLFLAYGVPSVIFGMIAGTFVDKVEKKSIIFWTSLIRAVLMIFLLFVSNNIVFVYLLLFLNAIVTQFFFPAEAAMIPKLVPSKELVSANSLFSFAFYSSMAVGFIIAGPLLRFTGPYVSIGILSCMYFIAAWFTSRLPKCHDEDGQLKKLFSVDMRYVVKKVWLSLSEGVSYVMKSQVLFDSVLLLTGTQIIIVMLGTLGPGFADRIMGIDIQDSSFIIVGPAIIGILVGAFWVGNKGFKLYSSTELIHTGIISAGILLLIISTTVYLKRWVGFDWLFTDYVIIPLEILLFFLLGVANSLLDVPANTILQKEAEGDMRGRVYGVLTAFVGGVGILPVMISGVLADVIGVGKVIFSLGILIVFYGIYRARFRRPSHT